MDPDAPILDYASPRKRTKLRLPAKSILTFQFHPEEIFVEERLDGKSDAVAGIAAACMAFVGIGVSISTPGAFRPSNIGETYFLIGLGVIELCLMLIVIHQTWRKTRLTVRYDQVLLSFSSPFHRRNYSWTGSDIANVLAVDTGKSDGRGMLAELVFIRYTGGDVHLFTDHFAYEIRNLSEEIPRVLGDSEEIPLPVEE